MMVLAARGSIIPEEEAYKPNIVPHILLILHKYHLLSCYPQAYHLLSNQVQHVVGTVEGRESWRVISPISY